MSSACSSLLRVSLVSIANLRSSSAILPDTKSGRPDDFFGFSNRIVVFYPQDVFAIFGAYGDSMFWASASGQD
jgi:hypothetical protein